METYSQIIERRRQELRNLKADLNVEPIPETEMDCINIAFREIEYQLSYIDSYCRLFKLH